MGHRLYYIVAVTDGKRLFVVRDNGCTEHFREALMFDLREAAEDYALAMDERREAMVMSIDI